MPYALGSSSCPLASFFVNKFSTINHIYTNDHNNLQPKNFTSTIVIINPSSKALNLSTVSHLSSQIALKSPFDFTITDFKNRFDTQLCCFGLKTSSLSISEIEGQSQEYNSKAKVKQLANEIRATPSAERSKLVKSLIEMHDKSKNIDDYNDLIMGLVVAEELDIALKLFDEMSTLHGLTPDCWTYSILIRCYCKKNQPDDAKQVLDCMIKAGFRPNVVTLTILVNTLCSRGRVQRAFEVLEMMGKYGCNPNVQTYNCVLKGLCFVGRIEEAYKMLMDMKRKGDNEDKNSGFPDIYSYTAVMDGLCKVGRSDEAMELLEEAIGMGLNLTAVTYNALFNGYCKEGKPRKGIQLLKQMKQRGCVPDYICYSTLLHGLLKWDQFMAAYWVFGEMVEFGLKVDERMMNTLLRGLCRQSWEQEELLVKVNQVSEKMKSWDYSIFPDTYYLVIQSLCIGKEVDMAVITLYEMVDSGYFPRMVVINRIIRGLCEEGKISQAMSVLALVCEAGKSPSKISFNILVDELNRQGNVLGACSLYGAALKLGVIPHRMPSGAQQSRPQ